MKFVTFVGLEALLLSIVLRAWVPGRCFRRCRAHIASRTCLSKSGGIPPVFASGAATVFSQLCLGSLVFENALLPQAST